MSNLSFGRKKKGNLYPPRMAKKGRSGDSKALAKYSNSFFIKKPATFFGRLIPTIDEWARWAVPNASLTYTSPSAVKDWRKDATLAWSAFTLFPFSSLIDPSSSIWNLKFSSKITWPFSAFWHASSTSLPTQSFKNTISRFNNFFNSSATGFN